MLTVKHLIPRNIDSDQNCISVLIYPTLKIDFERANSKSVDLESFDFESVAVPKRDISRGVFYFDSPNTRPMLISEHVKMKMCARAPFH